MADLYSSNYTSPSIEVQIMCRGNVFDTITVLGDGNTGESRVTFNRQQRSPRMTAEVKGLYSFEFGQEECFPV